MSSLEEIRTALASTISNGVSSTLFAYADVSELEELPAIIVQPTSADFTGAMARGTDVWSFNVFVVCSRADAVVGQSQLDGFVSGAGPDSIRQVLFGRNDLGLSDCSAEVLKVVGYGGTFSTAQVVLIGAVLKVRVFTDGRA